ncbi:MAG: S8 family peptidase [Roseiflexaceae bacterium]
MLLRTPRLIYALLLVASFMVACSSQPASPPTHAANVVASELIIRVEPYLTIDQHAQVSGGAPELAEQLRRAGARYARPIGTGHHTYRIQIQAGHSAVVAEQIRTLPGVAFAEPNHLRQGFLTPTDPVVRQQWALRNIQAFEAWDITTGGQITIAILDTGVSDSHPDLRGRVLDGYDFFNRDPNADDDEGHGTYTAGVAAAEGNNGEGIAGVCWSCRILPVKVLGSFGQGDDATIAEGIRWAVDQGARIISMSLGGDEDTQVLREAVQYATQRGALLIAASGNGQADGNKPAYPAAYPEVLAVSATDGSDTITGFSTYGDFVDISAPGVGVWSTGWVDGRDTYVAANGTSAACPYVAGAAALIWTLRPDLNADQVRQVLQRSADDRGKAGVDPEHGAGRLNLFRAVQLAQDPNLSFTAPPAAQAPGNNAAFARVGPEAATDGARYFPEMGHTLRGDLLAFWERHGGLPIFGYPISEEFVERGEDGRDYVVQYFERHRLEKHPENPPPYHVLLSRLGPSTLTDTGVAWESFVKTGPQPGCRYFAETGQSVCGNLLRYWETHGLEFDGRRGTTPAESLALFGLPISPPLQELRSDGRSITVQWFERARFEDHGSDGVLLGLLASELTIRRGWR